MQLNLPVLDQLLSCQNILIAGMGGGFDIFCGLPIYFELKNRQKSVHLANLSFSLYTGWRGKQSLTKFLTAATADDDNWTTYFPERYLAEWFRETLHEEITIWCFDRTGVGPLYRGYQALIQHLSIDGLLLIDGGVDSLMHGDEAEVGTIIEDSISLCAANQLSGLKVKLLTSIGFGAERDVTYSHVLENIAALTQTQAFLGSCSVTQQMEAYQLYKAAVMYVFDKPYQDTSVINASVISSVEGQFGNYHLTQKTNGSRLWISPLMAMYWFFDLDSVAARNLVLPMLKSTEDFLEVVDAYNDFRKTIDPRKKTALPY